MLVYGNKASQRLYANPPQGVYHAVCVDVKDYPNVEKTYKGKVKYVDQIRFRFQIDLRIRHEDLIAAAAGKPLSEEDLKSIGNRFLVHSNQMTLSISPGSVLTPVITKWRGLAITPEEEVNGIDIENFIGKNAMLVIVYAQDKNNPQKWYCNIDSILPPDPSKPLMEPENYIRINDREKSSPPSQPAPIPAVMPQATVQQPSRVGNVIPGSTTVPAGSNFIVR